MLHSLYIKHLQVIIMARVGGRILWLAYLFVVFTPAAVLGAKILLGMSFLVNTPSHHIFISSIAEPLVERGHEVVLLAPEHKVIKGLSDDATTGTIFFRQSRSKADMIALEAKLTETVVGISRNSKWEILQEIRKKLSLIGEGCFHLWKDYNTLRRLKSEQFDLIITIPAIGCEALLAEYLKVPFIIITPQRRYPFFSEDTFGIPIPSSYVPFNNWVPLSDQMTFLQRTANVLLRFVLDPMLRSYPSPISEIQQEHDIRPDLNIAQLLGKAALWLCQTHSALEFAQPTAPNYVSVGGITVGPAKPLSQDMEEFIQGSGEDGVIVFTLGSIVSSLMDDDLTEKLAKVFSELPQRVLWRYKGARPRNLGNNTLIADWLPQNDLLGNPKTRLLIYHGGANGIYEAVSHGVPLLLMPLAVDQMSNAVRIEAKGMGFAIDKNTLTEEIFREAIQEMLHNPKYTINAKKASAIMKDEIVPVREKVVFYVEHILKFGGDHFRSRALKLNFIQRESIDVTLFLFSVFVAFLCSARWVICKCCCRRCGSTPTNTYKSKCD